MAGREGEKRGMMTAGERGWVWRREGGMNGGKEGGGDGRTGTRTRPVPGEEGKRDKYVLGMVARTRAS